MSDRYNSLTVILDKDYRDDDSDNIINAIKMIKGVLKVKPKVADIESHVAEARVKQELIDKLWKVLYPD